MEGIVTIYQVIIVTAMALLSVLAGMALLFVIFFTDSQSFIHHCQCCGKALPRFHKGHCSLKCMIADRAPGIPPPPEAQNPTPPAIELLHSMHLFDKPEEPMHIYAIPCKCGQNKTTRFIAAHSPLQAYYRFWRRYKGFTPLPADPKPC